MRSQQTTDTVVGKRKRVGVIFLIEEGRQRGKN